MEGEIMELYLNFEHYVQVYRYKQTALFHALRSAILSGGLKPHMPLPSTRQLAKQYGMSRGTVSSVYDMLLAQDYIYTKAGSGTFVGDIQQQSQREQKLDSNIELSSWGQRVKDLALQATGATRINDGVIEFNLGKVELTYFPMKEWNRLLYEQVRQQYKFELHDAYSSDGHVELKETIARHVHKERGIAAEADDIVIVNGSQQGIALLAQLLLNEGDYAAIEDPHYVGGRHALQSVGAELHAYPVDEHGIVTSLLLERGIAYKLLLLTPSRQFPTGAVLSLERRVQLLQWAEKNNCFIIEDDYDSEFRYIGRAIEPMKSLDMAGRVIYIGTFSRTMLQDLRIGYMILPRSLKLSVRYAKMIYERHPSSIIQQRALAAFMSSGQYDRHLRRLKRIYRKRAELIQQLLAERLIEVLSPRSASSGLHIYADWRRNELQFERFLQACKQSGVYVVDARNYALNVNSPAICLGYAHLSEEDIKEGISRLVNAWAMVKAKEG